MQQPFILNAFIIVVIKYAQYLKRHYKQPLPDDDGLLTTRHRNGYVDLAVISSESLTHETDMTAETSFMTSGLRKEMLASVLNLTDILKPSKSGTPIRCVLIEGAPGIGKSTLVWQLCHKWEELDNMKRYKLVVLVSLRKAQEANCLKEMFPWLQCEDIDEDGILEGIGDGKGVLFILDGFDELPCAKRQSDSFFINLIKGVELPNTTVIITSRPSASADLKRLCKNNIDRHLEILGFNGRQIEKFVESEFRDGDKRVAFQQYLKINPIVKSMMHLPLYAVIVAEVFDGTKSPQLKTMIQLYDAFTRSLIRHHLVRNNPGNEDYEMPQSLQCENDINQLPLATRNTFYKLVEVAFNGLKTETYCFTDLGNNFDHLGVMKKVQSLDMSVGPRYAFSYLHLTFQEYLAALHIFYNPEDLELPVSFGKRDVLRFLAGLCCAHDNDRVLSVVGDLLGRIGDQLNLQLARCVYECNALVEKIPMVSKVFDGDTIIGVSGKMPFDYYIIGYCVCHVSGKWSITVHSRDEVAQLVEGLESKQQQVNGRSNLGRSIKGKIEDLQLLTGPFGSLLPILTKYTDLHSLKLYFVAFSASDADILQEYISHQTIKKIQICSCKNIELLLPIILGQSSLDTVFISGTLSTGTEHDREAYNIQKLLECNTNLNELSIDDAIFGPQRMIEVINSNSTLKKVTLFVTKVYESRKISHSFTGQLCRSTTNSIEPPLVYKTPLSLLQEVANEKKINLQLVDPHTYDTLKAPTLTRSHSSQRIH